MYYSMKQLEDKILRPDVARTVAYVISQGEEDNSTYRSREAAATKHMLWELCCGHYTIEQLRSQMTVDKY